MAPTAVCRFYQLGSCSNPKCLFAHSDEKVCQFYLQGTCKFGSYCELKHKKPRIQPVKAETPKPRAIVIKSEVRSNLLNKYEYKDRFTTKVHECVVCFEGIEAKKRFGLMDCVHCVCLDCIREWRDGSAKTCPICRGVSNFVVPSYQWPTSPIEKETIINNYLQSLKKIDCKHFGRGRGTCPFGSSCFYWHRDEYGIEEVIGVRIISNDTFEEDGLKVMKAVNLADFL